jgi:hypothetical protein
MCSRKLFIHRICLLLTLFTFFITVVRAQVDTASVTGQVTDQQGAVVAGARVVATNQVTNIAVETTTNDDGYYTLSNLRPSLYIIEAGQQNFKSSQTKNYELNVGQKARLDFALSVGDASAVVEVTTESQSLLLQPHSNLPGHARLFQLQDDASTIQLRCWLRDRAINQSAFFFQDRPEWSRISHLSERQNRQLPILCRV